MEWIRELCRILCLTRASLNLNNLKENNFKVYDEKETENFNEFNFDFLDKLPALLIFQIFSFTSLKPLDLRLLNHKFDAKIKNLYEKILRQEFHDEIRGIPLFWSFNVMGVKFIHQLIPLIEEFVKERRSERVLKSRKSFNKAKPEVKRKRKVSSFLSNYNEKVKGKVKVYCVDESPSPSSPSSLTIENIIFESMSGAEQFKTKTNNYSCEIKLMDLWSLFLKISEETQERKLLHFLVDFLIYIQVASLISQLKSHLVSLLSRVHDYDLSLAYKIIKLLGYANFLSFKIYRCADKEAFDTELGVTTTEQSAAIDSMIDQKEWENYDNRVLRALFADIMKNDDETEKVNNDRWGSCFELPNEIFRVK